MDKKIGIHGRNLLNFLGIEIDNLTKEEFLEKIKEFLIKGEKGLVVTPNASHIVFLKKDKEFFEAYKSAILIIPDGASLIIASKILGNPLKERSSGADLFPEVCKLAVELNERIFILGGRVGDEEIIQKKLKEAFPSIEAGVYSPPFGFEKDEEISSQLIKKINDFNTNVLFVAVGSPKSEKWLYKNLKNLEINLAFSVGSAVDFFAGIKRRAPKWMQWIGLEWFFRLIQEPRRLWKRYLIGNTIFLWLVFKEFVRIYFGKKIKNE